MQRRSAIIAMLTPAVALANPQSIAGVIQSVGTEQAWLHVQTMAKNNAGWLLIERRTGIPECLLSTLEDLGIQTLGQLDSFINRLGMSYAEVDALFPKVQKAATGTVTWLTIAAAAKGQFLQAKKASGDPRDALYLNYDASYQACTYSTALEIAKKFPWRMHQLWKDDNCEDAVYMLKGWLASQGLSGLAVGFCGMFMYNSLWTFLKGHAVPFVYCTDGRIYLIDEGKLVLPSRPYELAGQSAVSHCKLAEFSL